MPVISLPTNAMGPFGMPMTPGDGSSGGGGGETTFGGKAITQNGNPWVFDGPDADSAVDTMTGLKWIDNGNKLVAAIQTAGSNNSYGLYEFDTTTPYSTLPTDISYNGVNFLPYNEIADADFSPKSIEFSSDGLTGYFGEDNEIFGFTMTTAFDLSTATGTGHTKTGISHSAAPYGYGAMEDIKFNSDGTKMIVSEVSGNDCIILEFSLSTAYDVTTKSTNPTATFVPTTAGNSTGVLYSIHFNSDGTKMWAVGAEVGGAGQRWLYEYDLSTGFDVSTMSYNNERVDLETLAGIDLGQGLTFNNDFSKLYIACGNDGMFQFNWGTPSGSGVSREFTGETGNNITYSNASTGGTGDFTFEIFVDVDTVASNQTFATMGDTSVRYNSSSSEVELANTSGTKSFSNSALLADGTFDHIAVVRNGTEAKLYLNGSNVDSGTMDKSITGDVVIGSKADGNEPVNGRMYALRVAREQIYTSTFAPPKTALVETTNTDLVTLQTAELPPAKNGATPTVTGTVPTSTSSPVVSGGNVQAQESTFSGGISENAPGAGGAAGSAYAMAGSGLTSGFADEEQLKTNGTYTIVADANLNINHTGVGTTGTLQEIRQAGWAWIIRNSDGAVMKSWNGMLNGDHGDSSLVNETDGPLGVTSKFVNCKFGYAVGINDNYCFLGVPYRPTGGTVSNNNFNDQRAYLFAYKLSDFSLAKVWKVNDFASQIEPYSSSPMASSFGSAFLETGIEVTNDGLYVGSYRTKSTFGNVDGGAFSYFDISDNDPANWSSTPDAVVKNPINVVSNPTTLIGSSNFSNGDFGKGIRVSKTHADNVLVVNHVAWIHRYTRSGSSFTRTGQTNPNPAVYDGGYADISSDGKTWYAGDTTTGSQHVDAYDLDNNFNIKWSYSFTTNGSPGYSVRSYIHGGQEYILSGDGYDDTDGTDAGKLAVINADGTENKIVSNPTPGNQQFGTRFDINNGSLVTKVKPGGNSYGLQFMNGTSIFDAVNIPSLGFINMTSNYTSQAHGSSLSVLATGVTQSADKSYYLTGQVHSKSSWLFKFNEFGAFQWAREMGQYYLRTEAVITDSSNNVYIAGSDYGYGENFQAAGGTYDPQSLYIAKFNPSGTRQWSKVLRYNTISDNAASTYTGDIQIDSHGNLWMIGSVNWTATGLNSQTVVLYKVDSSGALSGVWYLPSSSAANNSPMGLLIDSNDNLYIALTQYKLPGGSYPHGVVVKMSIPGATGSPTYTWTKKFGITSSGAYYDVPYGMFKSSDGNLIVYGYTDNGGSGSNETTFMKLNDTNGALIWGKRYDNSYGDLYNANIDSNDKIYFTSESHNAGYTEYYYWVRQINATDGSHENIWEVDFTGNASNGTGWRFSSNTNMIKNRDGNIVLGMAPNGNAAGTYEPSIWKFPSTMVTGTFGKLEVSADSSTPTDATYNPIDQTYASYSTVTSVGGQFQTDNYNSGTYNDTVSTPTLTASRSTIKAASAPSGPQGWISTMSDELNGYGYDDVRINSLAVDSNDNIIAGGGAGGLHYQIVIRIKPDGTVDSAVSFGGTGATNLNRAIAVDSNDNVFTAGKAKDVWNSVDGHVMKLSSSLTKTWDLFFGEGYADEHYDIATNGTDAYAVGESTSYVANWNNDPKGYIVKYNSSGGEWKKIVTSTAQRNRPRGVSSDGNDVWMIGCEANNPVYIVNFSSNGAKRWSKLWGLNPQENTGMDIDCNSSLLTQSAACMFDGGRIHVIKLTAETLDWKIQWEKASTDHGTANPGYNWSSGLAVKLLSTGSVALLALGSMQWTTQSARKSFYIIVFDSSGNVTVEKEFRLTNSNHYLGLDGDVQKALVEVADGKIVTAFSYYTGSAWKNGIFKFDPTDTTNAINGVHGDWTISAITDSTSSASSVNYINNTSAYLLSSMSMYDKSSYQGGPTNGFPVGAANIVEHTQQTLNYASGSATPSGVLFSTTGTHTWTVPADVTTISVVAVGGGGGGFGYWNVDATELRIGTGGSGGHLAYANNIYVTPGETLDVTVGTGGAKGNQFGGAYGGVSYSSQPGVSSSVSRSSNVLVLAKGGDAPGNSNSDTNVGLASYSGGSGGGHGSTVTGGGGGGGAGGYSGTGGSGGSDQFNPWSPTAPGGSGSGGGGSGGRGAGGQTSTGQGGGGVGVYGEGSSGTGGQGAGGSSGTNGSSSAAGIYGGGGGAGYTSVVGAQGGVRIIWGDTSTARTFPTSNVDQASSTDAETTV